MEKLMLRELSVPIRLGSSHTPVCGDIENYSFYVRSPSKQNQLIDVDIHRPINPTNTWPSVRHVEKMHEEAQLADCPGFLCLSTGSSLWKTGSQDMLHDSSFCILFCPVLWHKGH